jgi:ribosome biogenesis protein MAK21
MKATMPKMQGDDDLMDEDSEDVPSGPDDSELDDEGEEKADPDSDGLSLAEASDNDDLIPFDNLIPYDGSDADDASGAEEEVEWAGFGDADEALNKKRKREGGSAKAKRKKIRSLPTFANYEEYSKMIEDGPEDNV